MVTTIIQHTGRLKMVELHGLRIPELEMNGDTMLQVILHPELVEILFFIWGMEVVFVQQIQL